jgi:phenylalanyl-tRNA synthetase beta chain
MRVPVEWLYEYCAPDLPVGELATRLAMTGTEVDRVEHHGVRELEHFVVGRVLQAEQHPDADRLTVCVVDVGGGEEAQIVCGAPNVAAGQLVAVGRPGAVMPGGMKLRTAKLRGVASAGMILAEDELAIGPDHDETLVLSDGDGLEPGKPLAGVLPISTDVLELEITPNRPDCLGVYGVAREAHAATGAVLARAPWHDDPALRTHESSGASTSGIGVQIVVEATDLCPRFTARAFEDVQIGPSPPWLKARLMAAGQRPINNIVDITNYVMLLTAQPMHAFDLDRIEGRRLVVRRAGDGEEVVTLDDQTRVADRDVCLIADDAGPTSIAGIMGGNRSEVQDDTTRVLMEAANWDAANIHATSLKLGLRSEASARFEKGLAPEQALDGQAVATRLMLELTGARLVPGTIDIGGPGPEPATIRLRDAKVVGLLGVGITRSESAMHLQRLGFETAERPNGLDVTVPPFRRNDITREADLIEEVARLHGVNDQLPATLPRRRGAVGVLTPGQRLRRRAEDALTGRGLLEVVGWSFEAPGRDALLRLPDDDQRRAHVVIENPMSEDEANMRTTLLGSLLDVARHNAARGQGVPGIFESGRVYLATGATLPHEHHALGALVPGDIFAAKGYLEALLRALRVEATFASAPQPFLHPGRSAAVGLGPQSSAVAGLGSQSPSAASAAVVGWVGDVHPLVAREWDLDRVAAFEIDLDAVIAAAELVPEYQDLTSFPELREDIAIVVDEAVPAATVLNTVRKAGGALLARAEVFDVYRGEQIAAGRTSLAIALTFRARDRTLTDEDVAPVRAKIVARLADELGGDLRG